jgi:hypothetical protein
MSLSQVLRMWSARARLRVSRVSRVARIVDARGSPEGRGVALLYLDKANRCRKLSGTHLLMG